MINSYDLNFYTDEKIRGLKLGFAALKIAKTSDPSSAFDLGFGFLLDRVEFDWPEYKEEVRQDWGNSGISQPEIREVIFTIMRGLNLFSDTHLKYLLCTAIKRLGHELPEVMIAGAEIEPDLREKDRGIIWFLGDTSDELKGKRPIDNFLERLELGNVSTETREAFYNSSDGLKLRTLGTIEWYCEPAANRSADYVGKIRPLFKQILSGQDYREYRQNQIIFMDNKFKEFAG